NLERGGNRFREHGNVGRYRVGHGVQVALGHGDIVGERAGVTNDADRRSRRAVGWPAGAAGGAVPAAAVDLADDALARERPVLRDADELMAEGPAGGPVSAPQLEV